MMKKRKAIRQQMNHPNRSGWYKQSILKMYFIKGKRTFKDLDPANFLRS
jgi:hypothetical protein